MNDLQEAALPRQFHLGDILSITHEYLVSPRRMVGVSDILSYMVGGDLFTASLIFAADRCRPLLLEQHPWLCDISAPDIREGAWWEPWLVDLIARYGEMHPVRPIAAAQRVIRDSTAELVEMVGPERVIVVRCRNS